jgi:hypothetical protein
MTLSFHRLVKRERVHPISVSYFVAAGCECSAFFFYSAFIFHQTTEAICVRLLPFPFLPALFLRLKLIFVTLLFMSTHIYFILGITSLMWKK